MVRLPTGLGGALLGAGAGTVIVPGYCLFRPGGRGLYQGVVHGVAAPACGYAWNTVVSPPLALVGRAPKTGRETAPGSEPSADRSGTRDAEAALTLGDVELEHLATWALCMVKELMPYAEQRESVSRDREDRIRRINREADVRTKALYQAERDHYEDLVRSPAHRDLLRRLGQGEFTPERLTQHEQELDRILKGRGLDRAQRRNAIRLLHRYPMQVRVEESPDRARGERP